MFTEKILNQFDNHDGHWCLKQQNSDLFEDWMNKEIIHFMFYHRWWTAKDIFKEMIPTGIDRQKYIQQAICRVHYCKASD